MGSQKPMAYFPVVFILYLCFAQVLSLVGSVVFVTKIYLAFNYQRDQYQVQGPRTIYLIVFTYFLIQVGFLSSNNFAGRACHIFGSGKNPCHRPTSRGEWWTVGGENQIPITSSHEPDSKSGGGNFPHNNHIQPVFSRASSYELVRKLGYGGQLSHSHADRAESQKPTRTRSAPCFSLFS